VEELRRDVVELRAENVELRREVGYWRSMHGRAIERNQKLQLELEEARAAAWKSGTEAPRLLAPSRTHSGNRCSGRRQSLCLLWSAAGGTGAA